MCSPPTPSCLASGPAIYRLARRAPCSCSRSWRLRRCSSYAACASAEGKSDEHHRYSNAGSTHWAARQPEARPALGVGHLVRIPVDLRDLLPDPAVLHDRNLTQERRRGRAYGDQSLDHRHRRHARPVQDPFTQTDFPIYFKNTAIVTVCVVCITMVVSVRAAFALGRMQFWGSSILATGIFLTYLVPDTLLFIPLFQIVKAVGLLNSYWGMVLVYPTLTVPFCTWIMIGYFQSIPKELDEAALIDGAGHLQMLLKIFIPVALPGIIAAMIFAFTVSWAAFVYPMAFLYSADQQVLTVGTVTSLIRGDVYKWGMLMAGALMAAAPPLVIYAFLMDYYIAGLTAGATKG